MVLKSTATVPAETGILKPETDIKGENKVLMSEAAFPRENEAQIFETAIAEENGFGLKAEAAIKEENSGNGKPEVPVRLLKRKLSESGSDGSLLPPTKVKKAKNYVVCTYEDCGKRFESQSKLKIHMYKHRGEKPCICPVCGQGKSTAYSLARHFKIHTKTKEFECQHCQHRFRQKSDRDVHVNKEVCLRRRAVSKVKGSLSL